jgi:hypothetical protein
MYFVLINIHQRENCASIQISTIFADKLKKRKKNRRGLRAKRAKVFFLKKWATRFEFYRVVGWMHDPPVKI